MAPLPAAPNSPLPAPEPDRPAGSRRLPGLDGVRALAVIAVMAYHFGVPHMQGGFLGVDIFFVLSGYLITSQLWARWGPGGIDLKSFWFARLRRLAPALGVLLLVTTAAIAALHPSGVTTQLQDTLAALTYTSNWWYVHDVRPYGDGGAWAMLQHLWSLAIEEQFYVVWPLVIAAVVRAVTSTRARRAVLLTMAVGGAVASTIAMSHGAAVEVGPWAANPTRVYFGTDTHLMGLLVGAALALVLDGSGFVRGRDLPRAGALVTLGGVVALATCMAAVVRVDFFDLTFYRVGGFLAFSCTAALLVWVAARDGVLSRVLGCPPLRYVGDRSYGLYLWHWPLVALPFVIEHQQADWRVTVLPLIAVTVVLAELSHRFVEMPIRRGGVRALTRTGLPALCLSTMLVAVSAVVAVRLIDPVSAPNTPAIPGLTPTATPSSTAAPSPTREPSSAASSAAGPDGATSTSTSQTSTQVPSHTPRASSKTKNMSVSVWGDSVPEAVAASQLPDYYKSVDNHAAVAAQASTVLPALMEAARAHRIPQDVVLLHTGDNGTIPVSMLKEALDSVKDKRVALVLPKTIRPEGAQARAALQEAAKGRPWVRLVDWYGASKDHPEYFADGTHLTLSAMPTYIALVQQASMP